MVECNGFYAANGIILFFSMAEYYSIVLTYNNFMIQSSISGHFGCFHALAIVNSAAVNMWVHVFLLRKVLSRYMPKSGISGSYGSSMYSFLWRTVWRYLRNLYIELPYDQAIPLLGTYPDKTFVEKDTCTCIFIAALFTIAKSWKQPKCPSTDNWIRKMWYIYTMEYCSAIKKNEIMPFATMWMELETLILSEVSQKEKDKYHMISLISGI